MSCIDACIERLSSDAQINEVLVNGNRCLVEVRGNSYQVRTPVSECDIELEVDIQRFAFDQGVRLDPLHPSNGGFLRRNGVSYRWHAVLRSMAAQGPLLSLRRQRMDSLSLMDFIEEGQDVRQPIEVALAQERPVLVFGPTGAGKTSFLAAILKEYCSFERVALLEHYPEVPLLSSHWISLQPRDANREGLGHIDFEYLFSELLRLRPDRVIVSEVRSVKEGEVVNQCLATGHGGFLSTFHADSMEFVPWRLQNLLGQSGYKQLLARHPVLVAMERGPCKPRIKEVAAL